MEDDPDFRPALLVIANATFNGTNLRSAEFETMEACNAARVDLEEAQAGSSTRAALKCFPRRLGNR